MVRIVRIAKIKSYMNSKKIFMREDFVVLNLEDKRSGSRAKQMKKSPWYKI